MLNKHKYIWINGEILESNKVHMDIYNHSLHYSGAVFEGEMVYSGTVFRIEDHITRLLYSAEVMQLKIPYSFNEIIIAHKEIIKQNNILNSYLRPLIWRESPTLKLFHKNSYSNFMIASVDISHKTEKSIKLHISRWKKPHPECLDPQVKSSGHYNMMVVSKIEARSLGFDDALLLDWRNFIAECTTTNIFFVIRDKLITPLPDAFLNGITRKTIILLAKNIGLEVQESHLNLSDLINFEECFVVGTASEIRSVEFISLNSEKIIFNKKNITELLKKEYNSLVRS